MEHNLFKPKSFEEGRHEVVGDCNGIPMAKRWEVETPLFARAILRYAKEGSKILDYGCGVGRISKEIITQNPTVQVVGTDASADMMTQAGQYVADSRFSTKPTVQLEEQFDVAYLVYVLQHVPSIEIRETLSRIHQHLKDDGTFIYCSSDYRMAIRFDNGGFFDDRFLGVNLQEEVARYFEYTEELFDNDTLEANPILKTMIKGGLPHPAKVFKKRKNIDYLHLNKQEVKPVAVVAPQVIQTHTARMEQPKKFAEARKLLLINRLAPGDCLVMTNAIRDLARAHPSVYQVAVRTPVNELFENNPYVTRLEYDENRYNEINSKFSKVPPEDLDVASHTAWLDDILVIDMHYPLIHRSGMVGAHFGEGHREWLEKILSIKIPQTEITPELYLSESEKNWISPVSVKTGHQGKYWLINAGSKGDFTLKQYPFYQKVVDLYKDKVTFVQIGQKAHNHVPLTGVLDMVGKTNLRELFRAVYFAEGVITCVSLPMHVAAAFKKPCVVIAGAREGTRWELYPNQQFLYVNGCLPCATYDGCWKSREDECKNRVNGITKCMTLITPEDIVRSIQRYYDGGMLS